jgi:uncharacterized protein YcaQ
MRPGGVGVWLYARDMATVHELSRADARRIAVRAQLLTRDRADRKAGVLRVAAVHRDVPFSNAMTAAVDREIADLARWLDLELVLLD